MEFCGKILCATHAELTDGIMTNDTLMYYCKKNPGLRVRRAGFGSPALYDVSKLRHEHQAAPKEPHPETADHARAMAFVDTIMIDCAASDYYERVRIDGARGLTYEKRMLYTNSASILNAIRAHLQAAADEQRKVGRRNRVKMSDWWVRMAEYLPRVADIYPHSLPSSPRVLQRRYNEYWRGGEPDYGVLVSGKFRNRNAAKVVTETQIAWLTQFAGYHTNCDCVEVAEAYNAVADSFKWKKVTPWTVWKWALEYGIEIGPGKYGAKKFMNEIAMQNKRYAPTSAMLYWTLDGWTVELYYKAKGKNRTTYTNRLTVVVVLDPHNKYPIGYAIGSQECPALITAALKNAVNHTAELFGQRYRPYQLQSDNYAIKTMLPTYGALAGIFTPAKAQNSKAKVIEPYFKYLNKRYAKKCHGNWSGYGITARKESQPNMDWLNAHRKQIPDREGVAAQIVEMMETERSLKVEKYRMGWNSTPEDKRMPMDAASYLMIFGEQTGYKNALSGSGLNVKLLGERRTYDSFDIEFRRHAHMRWNIKYDPDDLSEVLAVSDEGDIRFMLEEKYVQPMALADRKPGDAEQLERVRNFNDGLKRHIIEFNEQAREIISDSLLEHPDCRNEYVKSMITDSRGQNKDRRNELRLEYSDMAEDVAYEETHGAGDVMSTRDLY